MEGFLVLVEIYQGAIAALATAVIALMAIVTAFLTGGLIRENRLLRKAGMEPKVVAYLTTHPQYATMVNFVLANIGQGAARNVRFRFDAEPQDFASHNVQIDNTVEREAISLLPQGEKIEAFFGAGPDLYKEPRLRPFKVVIDYEDMTGKRRSGTHVLDVSEFDGLITLGEPAERAIADALKKIEGHIRPFATGFRRLKVETITAADARDEAERRREEARQQRQKK